jgi:RNA polymerase sigma factor (sigma-70 family)
VSRFERLYRENFPFVWAAARRCGAPSHAVDDVVQDVFVTAYRRIDELYYEVSPRGWLYGVTRRVAFRYRRSAARLARRRAVYGPHAPTSAEPHAEREAARDLEALLLRIDAAQRETFVMAELLGMSGPEIAGELRVPVDTVYSRLRLARRRLATLAGSAERLHAGVARACEAQRPAPAEQARTWAAIVPVIGAKSIAIPTVSLATLKSVLLPLSLAAAAVTVVVHSSAAPARAGGTNVTDVEPSRPTPHEAIAASRAVPLAEPEAADASTPAEPAPAAPRTVARDSSRPGAAPRSSAPARVEAESASAAEALAQELALLDDASAAASRGEPSQALEVLAEHARRFPHGQLEDARRATRVQVLCDLGRTEDARAEATALRRDRPDSAVAARTEKTCARS